MCMSDASYMTAERHPPPHHNKEHNAGESNMIILVYTNLAHLAIICFPPYRASKDTPPCKSSVHDYMYINYIYV